MVTDGPSPASPHPPKGWWAVYHKTTFTPFSSTLEGTFEKRDEAVTYAETLSGKTAGRFDVVNPKGLIHKSFGEIAS